jgi:hypothetical protein
MGLSGKFLIKGSEASAPEPALLRRVGWVTIGKNLPFIFAGFPLI